MIFDAHLHLPCFDEHASFEEKKQHLLRDLAAAGVGGGIVISDSETSSPIGTPEECAALFADTENIFVMAGSSPLIDYEARLRSIDLLLRERKAVALKLFPGHEAYDLDDSRLEPVFALCEQHNVPLAVHSGWDNPQYNRPRYFAQIARAHPALRIVICHLCWPDIDQCFDETAIFPNVYYDISSLADDVDALASTVASLRKIAATRADRLIFGSDYGDCSISDHVQLVRALGLGEREEQMIFAGNAMKLYQLTFSEEGQ